MRKLGFNQFDLDINFTLINRDFITLKFTKDDRWLSYQDVSEMDVLLTNDDCKAMSVCFTGGTMAYALYRRKEFGNKKPISILKDIESKLDVRVEFAEFEEIQPYRIFQLFLNACNNSTNPRYRYNNLNGCLFITSSESTLHNKKDQSRIAMEVKVQKQNIIKLETVTFTSLRRYKDLVKDEYGKDSAERKQKLFNLPQYYFDSKNTTFRRNFDKDKAGWDDLYVRMRPKERFRKGNKKKNQIPFLNLHPKKYSASKVGMWASLLMEAFEIHFGKYIQVHQKIIKGERTKVYNPKQSLFEPLNEIPIYLINNVGERELIEKIRAFYQNEFGIKIQASKKINKNGINLLFNHDKEYYTLTKNVIDPYKKSKLDCPIQNFTKQEYISKGKNQLFKTLLEAHIKYDITKGKLSVFDWSKLGMKQDWYFAIAEQQEDRRELIFHFLKINSEGGLKFSTLEQSAILETLHNRMVAVFNDNLDRKGKPKIDGVLFDGGGNLNTISQTSMFTMPELSSLHFKIMQGSDLADEAISRQELLTFTQNYIENYGSNNQIESALDFLGSSNKNSIPLTEFQSFFKGPGSRKLTIQFVHEFWGNFGFWLKQLAKNKTATAATFGSMVDLHAVRRGKEMLFWANKNMGRTQGAFLKTNIIRSLKAWGNSSLLFNNLLEIMAVDFVRVDAPSVMPFPFKMLREYQRIVDNPEVKAVDFGEFNFNV